MEWIPKMTEFSYYGNGKQFRIDRNGEEMT